MIRTSEFVSIGHPDKIADYISSKLLDAYLASDPNTRFAVEVQVKDNFVSLAGEVTSKASFDRERIDTIVREAVSDIGYTHEYAMRWGADNAMDADALQIVQHIGKQSPDIAQGVDKDGWGDQGIFWGMADRETESLLPYNLFTAQLLGRILYEDAKKRNGGWGLDIKTQITTDNRRIVDVVVAIPCLTDADMEDATRAVTNLVSFDNPKVTVNGTGRYVRHSAQGDCGTTGRKLAVDFYGGNCFIGGGSPWTKDGSKADVALNLLARRYAVEWLNAHDIDKVFCSISCCIGKTEIRVTWLDGQMNQLATEVKNVGVAEVQRLFNLKEPIYADLCREGLFSKIG